MTFPGKSKNVLTFPILGDARIVSDGDIPVIMELWGMQSTPSLPSLSGPLCPGVVARDRVLSIYESYRTKLRTNAKLNCLK